jgi:hypothetical protein
LVRPYIEFGSVGQFCGEINPEGAKVTGGAWQKTDKLSLRRNFTVSLAARHLSPFLCEQFFRQCVKLTRYA